MRGRRATASRATQHVLRSFFREPARRVAHAAIIDGRCIVHDVYGECYPAGRLGGRTSGPTVAAVRPVSTHERTPAPPGAWSHARPQTITLSNVVLSKHDR